MIPSLGLIFLVLGTIFMGLATPTEAGAMGVVGAIALAWFYGSLTWPLLYQGWRRPCASPQWWFIS
jgi:TRAP-type mannitol/chloroaromatic compound transport system permease large subunit